MNKSHQAENLTFPLAVDASSTRIQVGIPGEIDWVHLETVELSRHGRPFPGYFATSWTRAGINPMRSRRAFFLRRPRFHLGVTHYRSLCQRPSCGKGEGKTSLHTYNALDLASRMIAPSSAPFASALPERLALRQNTSGRKCRRKQEPA